MRVLLVSATSFEVQPTLKNSGYHGVFSSRLGAPGEEYSLPTFDCLITGVGQLQCAVWLARVLSQRRYDIVIQAGIAGSFRDTYPHRSVVLVGEEVIADLGAESPHGFLDIFDMGLIPRDQQPFSGGVLRAAIPDWINPMNLASVRSVTVNRVLSDPRSIGWVEGRYEPDIVSMEGAAFFYTCLTHGTPCAQLRAISDRVGPRDTSTWDIAGAIEALNASLFDLLRLCANQPGSTDET